MRFRPFKRRVEALPTAPRSGWRFLAPRRARVARAGGTLAEDIIDELAAAIRPHELHAGDTDATLVAAYDILRRARERNRPVWPLALHLRSMFAGIPRRDGAPATTQLALPLVVDGVRRLLYRAALGVPLDCERRRPEA